ncbi:hypothetical protein QE152_g30877 [Popillia japonica]|uniref:Uncharacterized protein n=1 Tax=Popillia japonica TaxID=7064 RepID=A0AAW1JCT9_POPJA
MPNQIKRQTSIESEDINANHEKTAKPSPAKPKPAQKNEKPAARTGWFGGIFSGFGLRPKNQMKLPDDKNPSIVWDENHKKWVNLDEDGTETSSELKPPPKMAEMVPQNPNGQPGQAPYPANPAPLGNPTGIAQPTQMSEDVAKPTQPNMFKLQRGRNLKKSYVDVFNPSGKSSENSQSMVQNPVFLNATPSGGSQVNFFVPAPVNDPNAPVDFLTPGSVNTDSNQNAYQQPQ